MESIRIINGDVDISGSGRVQAVVGPEKIRQDLIIWLFNDLGFNRFHPWAGAGIQDFIGGTVSSVTAASIKATVNNTLSLYYANQIDEMRRRIESASDPLTAIALAEPDSLVDRWFTPEVVVSADRTGFEINIGFETVSGLEETFSFAIVNSPQLSASDIEQFNNSLVGSPISGLGIDNTTGNNIIEGASA